MTEPDPVTDGATTETAATGTTGADAGTAGADAPETGILALPPVTERELAARRRGLASAYIAGGDDPDPERTHREEARFVRLLVIMVVAIVGSGLLVTFVGLFLAGPAR
jgi:hypothetical protein